MKRLLAAIGRAVSSRATSPVVLSIFLVLYIALAFGTDEALVALMGLTAASLSLKLLLAVLPLSAAARLFLESRTSLRRRRLLRGGASALPEGLFDESVEIAGAPPLERVSTALAQEGYATRMSGSTLGAWRGGGGSAARVLFLAAVFSLFAGILTSVSTRETHRATVVEGEPLPTADGTGGIVEKISLVPSRGLVLARDVVIRVAPSQQGDAGKECTLYPPARYRGNFVYPRYLGLAPQLSLVAPDLREPYLAYHVLNIYPPGREDQAELPGTPYRLVVSLAESADGSDPFVTGRGLLTFKLLRGNELVASGSAPAGGEFVSGGYRVGAAGWKRIVQTDFVRDNGVPLIWVSGLLFGVAFLVWFPSRVLFPRREMLFVWREGRVQAFSRAEGRRRRHAGVFSEALDLLEQQNDGREKAQNTQK